VCEGGDGRGLFLRCGLNGTGSYQRIPARQARWREGTGDAGVMAPGQRSFSQLIRESLDALKAVTAGR
jgi:hypothetical protein